MRGINEKVAYSQKEKLLKGNSLELNLIINQITTKFIELLKKNKMLGVEILFRFPSREIKDQILSNYEKGVQGSQAPNAPFKKKQIEYQASARLQSLAKKIKPNAKSAWTAKTANNPEISK